MRSLLYSSQTKSLERIIDMQVEGEIAPARTCAPGSTCDFCPDATTKHHYEPLESATSIRLLRVFGSPGKLDDAIQCEIAQFDRTSTECPQYRALSYAWGDISNRVPIVLNKQKFEITVDLYEALVQLRDMYPDTAFWVDQICINQEDKKEQGHQVAQMRHIYGEASEVISWLGPETGETDRLFEFVRNHHRERLRDGVELVDYQTILEQPLAAAFYHIMHRQYWRRIWVLQEIVTAAYPLLMCGRQTWQWSTLMHGLEVVLRPLEAPNRHLADSPSLNWEYYITALNRWAALHSLASALFFSRWCLATDSRDQVYAILGLVNDGAGVSIVADYTCSPCAVYRTAIDALVVDWYALQNTFEKSKLAITGHVGGPLNFQHEDQEMKDALTTSCQPSCTGMDCETQNAMFRIAGLSRTLRGNLEVGLRQILYDQQCLPPSTLATGT